MRTDIGFLRALAAQRGLGLERPPGCRSTVMLIDAATGGVIRNADRREVFTPLQARRYLTRLPEKRWIREEIADGQP